MAELDIPVCEVPAGTYPLGDEGVIVSRPEHSVTLDAFLIARVTVTNLDYLAFTAAGGYREPRWWTDMGWRWRQSKDITQPAYAGDSNWGKPDQPVVGVGWYEAVAYATWLAEVTGQPWRLPTEAEWEAAARGVEGDAPRPRRYNTAEQGLGYAWAVTEPGNISWCGAWDLCGNVWEWCSTRWGHNWQTMDFAYPYKAGDGRELLLGSHARIMRGGSWFDGLRDANPANRGRYLPGSRGSNIGFRLARSH